MKLETYNVRKNDLFSVVVVVVVVVVLCCCCCCCHLEIQHVDL